MTNYALGVAPVSLEDKMRDAKADKQRRERMENAVGTVCGESMSALIAALNTIEEIGERLHKSPSMRPWGIRLTDAAQDIRDSIYLEG